MFVLVCGRQRDLSPAAWSRWWLRISCQVQTGRRSSEVRKRRGFGEDLHPSHANSRLWITFFKVHFPPAFVPEHIPGSRHFVHLCDTQKLQGLSHPAVQAFGVKTGPTSSHAGSTLHPTVWHRSEFLSCTGALSESRCVLRVRPMSVVVTTWSLTDRSMFVHINPPAHAGLRGLSSSSVCTR